jgi:hypothetical protein
MKKIILFLFLLTTLKSFSQDSTIATLSIKARLVQTLVPYVKQNIDDTAYINLLQRWVKKYDVANPPNNTTQVSVDSIKVQVIAALYGVAYGYPQGVPAIGSDYASDILTIRNANTYLGRLCDAIDARFANMATEARTRGRKILTGKNN